MASAALYDSPRSPKTAAPRWTGIGPSHPHARKNSLDVASKPADNGSKPVDYTSSLESISESSLSPRSPGFSDTVTKPPGTSLRPPSNHARQVSLPTLGRPRDAFRQSIKSVSATYSTPGMEHINYAFAQFTGTFALDSAVDASGLKRRLRRAPFLGGGRMDMPASACTSFLCACGSIADEPLAASDATEFPTFEQQPAVFFTDFYLGAGESKSCQ
jgi:hypothetical protein